jgi:2,5-diketo-D-gluconate reductase A
MQTVTLNNGIEMPILGFGVYQIGPDETEAAVTQAIAAGYRLIDTAAGYGNEEAVGAVLAKSGVPREELFITTKLWIQDNGEATTRKALEDSLNPCHCRQAGHSGRGPARTHSCPATHVHTWRGPSPDLHTV